jgi:hypothetical protein
VPQHFSRTLQNSGNCLQSRFQFAEPPLPVKMPWFGRGIVVAVPLAGDGSIRHKSSPYGHFSHLNRRNAITLVAEDTWETRNLYFFHLPNSGHHLPTCYDRR